MIKVKSGNLEKDKIEPYFDAWSELQGKIFEMHDKRIKGVQSLMEEGIRLYEKLVLFCSGLDEHNELTMDEYEVLPINAMERIQFVKMRPGQFASFRQLDELFKETKKKIARLRVQK